MPPCTRRWFCLALGACFVRTPHALAVPSARRQRELPYGFAQVWSTALRLVRVDLRLPVTDRDQEGGYVMFTWLVGDKGFPGSLELSPQGGDKVATVVVAQVEGQPSYVAQMLLDRLEKKLRTELGAPPPARPRPPSRPPAEVDAGADDAGEQSP
ncbi:MAG: hypothetical protein ABW252_15080 [Polyangiales bacterium]